MRKLVALVVFLAFATAARAEERATTNEAEMMVHNAVAFLDKEGKEKAFAVFSDPKGAFTYRDLYIFVIDLNGIMRAHGTNKALIGRNELPRKDPTGKFFTREMVELAKTKGSGWIEYQFVNPATGKLENKVVFLERVDDVFVGCGAFVK